jgi:hypothetical protein
MDVGMYLYSSILIVDSNTSFCESKYVAHFWLGFV